MLVSQTQLALPRRTLIVDLISRSGSPNQDSLSPYDGYSSEVLKQFPNFQGDVAELLSKEADYEASKQKPQVGPYVKDRVGNPSDYLTKLEDIDSSWVYQYTLNKLVGLKLQRAGGVKEFENNNKEIYITTMDDGTEISESEVLTITSDDYSPEQISKATAKIPYILKRLHEKSKVVGIHLLSLIIAYERAKVYTPPGKIPKPSQIIHQGVYYMSPYGTAGDLVHISANSGKVFPPANKWVRGEPEYQDSYYTNMLELLDICDIAGIDLKKENPLTYQEEFIDKLVVSYIERNREYVQRKHKGFNRNVLDALKNISLDAYDQEAKEAQKGPDRETLILNTMQRFAEINVSSIHKDQLRPEAVAKFITYYNYLTRSEFDMNHLLTNEGFLFLTKSIPAIFNVAPICAEKYLYQEALIHISGYAIIFSQGNQIVYQDIETLTQYLQEIVERRSFTYYNNTKFGRWEIGTV